MKTLLCFAALGLGALALGATVPQDLPKANEKLEQHRWLRQLVGDWSLTSEAVTAPGEAPVEWKSRETIRSIGGLWVVSEGSADADGEPFTSILTLGYDPSRKAFVGSWIDSIQPTLWTYVGQLDEAKRVLTLEAEGPSMTDPKKTGKYRDSIEIVSSDHRRMTSSYLAEDGTWTSFMTMNARRVE